CTCRITGRSTHRSSGSRHRARALTPFPTVPPARASNIRRPSATVSERCSCGACASGGTRSTGTTMTRSATRSSAVPCSKTFSPFSERYAEEILTPEFGERLEGLLRERRADLWGITNGIDTKVFDPAHDPNIPAHYDADDQSGKAICKAALQKETGLSVDASAPVFGVIGRLVEQKGVDLLTAIAP